jgi:hypothetical protein
VAAPGVTITGVDAAEFAVERDRFRSLGGDAGQGESALDGAGEGGGADTGVAQGVNAGLVSFDEVEHPGQADGGAHDVGCAAGQMRMSGVCLDDDRAAGGQRRGGVAACHAEGEREVAGGEDQHRAEGDAVAPQLWSVSARSTRS